VPEPGDELPFAETMHEMKLELQRTKSIIHASEYIVNLEESLQGTAYNK
jgi:hypothetical protein